MSGEEDDKTRDSGSSSPDPHSNTGDESPTIPSQSAETFHTHRVGPHDPLTEGPGTVIDRFRLEEQLGEGGFGVVYRAEQTEPVRRHVALKIIKLGMDTRQIIMRFEAERQALAVMDHPNIAKVFDAGATGTGRPYFVMELVQGVSITSYCDEKGLSPRERLRLFIQVCSAVQHAHQKGIIHRDIKPSNVLVAEQDGVPVPKVIDFGIAKATERTQTEQTMFTEYGQFIGTPQYMSPEQAEATGLDIDTRSDIYSLGVLLYELMTGATPFDVGTLRGAAMNEIQRIIREEEPSKPSTRISTLGEELPVVAQHRGLPARKLSTVLAGDLDWMIMKAMEKDRARRYETANGLADDIERYLNDEPVLASPPSATYRLGKMIRRNKAAFAVTAVITLLLLGGIAGTTLGLLRARRAETTAITEAARSQQVAEFMQAMLEGVGPSVARGRDTALLREILDRTAGRVGEELDDQPGVEAPIRSTLGSTYFELSEFESAENSLRRALELYRSVDGGESEDVSRTLGALGLVKKALEEFDESEKLMRDALEIQREIAGEVSIETAQRATDLANLLVRRRDIGEEPERLLLQSLDIQQELQGEGHEDVAIVLNSLAILYTDRGELAIAEDYYRRALRLHTDKLGEDHPHVAIDMHNLAQLLEKKGATDDAEKMFMECLALSRVLFPDGDGLTASVLEGLAGIRAAEHDGGPGQAIELYEEALAMRRALFGDDHDSVANTLRELGEIYEAMRNYDVADACFRDLLASKRKRYGDESLDVALALQKIGSVHRNRGEYTEALSVNAESIEIQRKLLGNEHPEVAISLWHRGVTLYAMGDTEGSAATLREALQIHRATNSIDTESAINCMERLARALRKLEELPESAKILSEAVAVRKRLGSDRTMNGLGTLWELAQTLGESGETEQADQIFRDVISSPDVLGAANLAHVRMSYADFLSNANRFADADAQLVSAYETFSDPQIARPGRAAAAVEKIIALNESRHAADPNGGYGARASEWQMKLEAASHGGQ